MKRIICWWFGCDPDYSRGHGGANFIVPCRRCGAFDTMYCDRVGDTRHARMMASVRYWAWTRWFGNRSKGNSDVPF